MASFINVTLNKELVEEEEDYGIGILVFQTELLTEFKKKSFRGMSATTSKKRHLR